MTHSFADLALIEPLQRAVRAENYRTPTPIQAQAIPHLLAGRDLLGIAQTGTGKTAAFALPILQRLGAVRMDPPRNSARALILTPTRELAVQIAESFQSYGRHMALRTAVIFGGVPQRPQVQTLARGVDILVATPGRLLDLMQQGYLRLRELSIFVLDEADRMLDMGFIHDVKRVVATLPKTRQTLFFSATMPAPIAELAGGILSDPVRVTVTPAATTVERIDQRVYFLEKDNKPALLIQLLKDPALLRTLVFSRTKHGADRITRLLDKAGIVARAIHGNKSQTQRQRALADFRDGRARVLVATDIAARGIDIDGISHVVNFDLPEVPETYVHRIGRTARAGAHGLTRGFCDGGGRLLLREVGKATRRGLAVVADHPFHAAASAAAHAAGAKPGRQPQPHRGAHKRPEAGKGQGHGQGQKRPNGNGRRRRHGGAKATQAALA